MRLAAYVGNRTFPLLIYLCPHCSNREPGRPAFLLHSVGHMLLPRQDQRKAKRRPMRRAALVSFAPVGEPVRCVVWDMSDSGARLAVACPTAEVPHKFQLILTSDGSVCRDCEVVWINTRFVGVTFRSSQFDHGSRCRARAPRRWRR